MSIFVQLVATGKIDSKKDTKKLNEVLSKLQADGATIKNVTLATSSVGSMFSTRGDYAVYVITYEGNTPISI